jgi:signal transduction histidine kinase
MVLVATAGTFAIRGAMGSSISILFFPAVLFSAIYGGYGPALLATVLSTATLAYIVIRPHTSFEIGADDLIRLGVFAVVAMVTASISSARKRAEDAQRQALGELRGALEILQQVAVREERLRLARDLHDGVLQSFTGIRLRLEALAGNPDATPSARDTLLAVERAIAIEQRELRSFIEDLKPMVRAVGAAGAVAPVLEELRDRLAMVAHADLASGEPRSDVDPGCGLSDAATHCQGGDRQCAEARAADAGVGGCERGRRRQAGGRGIERRAGVSVSWADRTRRAGRD